MLLELACAPLWENLGLSVWECSKARIGQSKSEVFLEENIWPELKTNYSQALRLIYHWRICTACIACLQKHPVCNQTFLILHLGSNYSEQIKLPSEELPWLVGTEYCKNKWAPFPLKSLILFPSCTQIALRTHFPSFCPSLPYVLPSWPQTHYPSASAVHLAPLEAWADSDESWFVKFKLHDS